MALDENRCPACGARMVARTNRKDQSKFWGCSNYPRCKGTRNTDGEAPRQRGEMVPGVTHDIDGEEWDRSPSERQRDNDRRRW